MKDRIMVLCRPAVAAGFRLAGFDPLMAENPADGARHLAALLDEPEAGVVLVQEDFYAALSLAAHRGLARRSLPLVVPFPAPTRMPVAESPDAFIAELLRQAIGYRVRLG